MTSLFNGVNGALGIQTNFFSNGDREIALPNLGSDFVLCSLIMVFRTFNDDIVSCSLKFPGEDWFYGESLLNDDMNSSSFDDVPRFYDIKN